jgi:hypothetical protein
VGVAQTRDHRPARQVYDLATGGCVRSRRILFSPTYGRLFAFELRGKKRLHGGYRCKRSIFIAIQKGLFRRLTDVPESMLPARAVNELEKFFEATDALEDKKIMILGWKGPSEAINTIKKHSRQARSQ